MWFITYWWPHKSETSKPCAHFKYSEYIHVLFLFRRRFGDVFRLRFGHRPVVVLCGPKAVREALVEKADSFSERPDWTALVNAVRGGKGITFNIHDWQFTRRFAMTTLWSWEITDPASLHWRNQYRYRRIQQTEGQAIQLPDSDAKCGVEHNLWYGI